MLEFFRNYSQITAEVPTPRFTSGATEHRTDDGGSRRTLYDTQSVYEQQVTLWLNATQLREFRCWFFDEIRRTSPFVFTEGIQDRVIIGRIIDGALEIAPISNDRKTWRASMVVEYSPRLEINSQANVRLADVITTILVERRGGEFTKDLYRGTINPSPHFYQTGNTNQRVEDTGTYIFVAPPNTTVTTRRGRLVVPSEHIQNVTIGESGRALFTLSNSAVRFVIGNPPDNFIIGRLSRPLLPTEITRFNNGEI